MKKCSQCSKTQSLSEFHVYKTGPRAGKIWSQCKTCRYAQLRVWRKKKPDHYKKHYRAARLKGVYGITESQYDEILLRQNGCCAICLRDAKTFTTRLAIDHDHRTGQIRGLLCTYCNHRTVGRYREEHVPLLERVITYLKQGTGLFVPEKKKKRRKKRK